LTAASTSVASPCAISPQLFLVAGLMESKYLPNERDKLAVNKQFVTGIDFDRHHFGRRRVIPPRPNAAAVLGCTMGLIARMPWRFEDRDGSLCGNLLEQPSILFSRSAFAAAFFRGDHFFKTDRPRICRQRVCGAACIIAAASFPKTKEPGNFGRRQILHKDIQAS